MTTINMTKRGKSLIKELTELRRIFNEMSKAEHSISPKSFSDVQDDFIKSMRSLESEIVEEIYNGNDFESGWSTRQLQPGFEQGEVYAPC